MSARDLRLAFMISAQMQSSFAKSFQKAEEQLQRVGAGVDGLSQRAAKLAGVVALKEGLPEYETPSYRARTSPTRLRE